MNAGRKTWTEPIAYQSGYIVNVCPDGMRMWRIRSRYVGSTPTVKDSAA